MAGPFGFLHATRSVSGLLRRMRNAPALRAHSLAGEKLAWSKACRTTRVKLAVGAGIASLMLGILGGGRILDVTQRLGSGIRFRKMRKIVSACDAWQPAHQYRCGGRASRELQETTT